MLRMFVWSVWEIHMLGARNEKNRFKLQNQTEFLLKHTDWGDRPEFSSGKPRCASLQVCAPVVIAHSLPIAAAAASDAWCSFYFLINTYAGLKSWVVETRVEHFRRIKTNSNSICFVAILTWTRSGGVACDFYFNVIIRVLFYASSTRVQSVGAKSVFEKPNNVTSVWALGHKILYLYRVLIYYSHTIRIVSEWSVVYLAPKVCCITRRVSVQFVVLSHFDRHRT